MDSPTVKRKPGRPKKVHTVAQLESSVDTVSEAPQFTITIKIDNATYTGEGSTALEALQFVPTPPLDFVSSGSVVVTKGTHVREMFYSTSQLKRLLNPYHMEVLSHILTEGM